MPKKKAKGGGGEAALTKKLEAEVAKDIQDNTVLKLDDKFSEEADALRATLEESRGKLASLDPETAASLDTQQAAREALLERRFSSEKDTLLGRLFGSGIERSTIAGRVGGQLLGDQGLVLQQSQAAHEANVLSTRLGLTEQNLQNLGMQSGILSDERQGAIADLQLQAQQISDARNRRAGLLTGAYDRRSREQVAQIGADAQVKSSRISASAQVRSATLAAEASKFGSSMALQAARVRADATKFSASQHASASRYGADSSLRAAQLHADASRFNTEARLRTDILGLEQAGSQFDANLGQRQHEFSTEDARSREFFERDLGFRREELRSNERVARQQARAQQRSSMLGGIGGLLGGIASVLPFSDERLKEDIEQIQSPVEKVKALRGVTWKWRTNTNLTAAGVIAQDVEKVLPQAVSHSLGYRTVDYAAIVGLLVEAVAELAKEKE
jgi:hypothetical protein